MSDGNALEILQNVWKKNNIKKKTQENILKSLLNSFKKLQNSA